MYETKEKRYRLWNSDSVFVFSDTVQACLLIIVSYLIQDRMQLELFIAGKYNSVGKQNNHMPYLHWTVYD